ncbi:ABC transporter permease [Cohnella sp. CFH 77786]|uniref:ABC transporter permease n=1 Tax=Cohnella sp. CFH 77786 TaxID=2662265 RepID=UPI001C609954|nr:ABC-2 family transporter protein [Cohnella sp. CFH 77786]MBW5445744.1 ABC transporter permease [Cohnella sp. CFH 77786]
MRVFGKYWRCFQMGMQNAIEYRADFLIGLVSGSFAVLLQVFLWTAMFESGDRQTLYGYSYQQMIAYVIIAGIVSRLVATGFEYEVAGDIKSGGLSKFIVQPIHYLYFRMFCFFGSKAPQSLFIFIVAIATVLLVDGSLHAEELLRRLAFFVPAMLLALALNFFIFYCVSILAFWLTEAWAAFIGLNLLINICSGGVFPLDVFGATFMKIVSFSPFPYTIFFPINILNGKISADAMLQGCMLQLLWIVVLMGCSGLWWKQGMKKYIAVGG